VYRGQIVFAQLMELLPRAAFDACVRRYPGQRKLRGFSCRDQFLCMAFAQLSFRQSLRDVETCLRAMQPKLYHAGFRGPISRSTLADANRHRDWRIYHDFAQVLISQAQELYAQGAFAVALQHTVYALDSTLIELCLALFPWAHSQRQKGAIKLHTLVDLRGNIPCFVRVSTAKTPDCTVLDHLPVEPGSYYVMDRGYNDYRRLHRLSTSGAWFIVRGKQNLTFHRLDRRPVDRASGLRSDQTIRLKDRRTTRKYPDRLRRIHYFDALLNKRFLFITNDFSLPALTIAELYRCRWQVELFFKWIKQNLRIQHFLGNSPNAVKTQVWIAISTYLLVAILKKQLGAEHSMSQILQILSVTLFEKTSLNAAIFHENQPNSETAASNQLHLFDL
jgi:DDE family transposase/uncharacterized protein DUF4372